jgi:hypothetical protein
MQQHRRVDAEQHPEISMRRQRLQNEVNYYLCCLDEIRDSNDPEYRALSPIYESLLAHRRQQLERLDA